MGKRSATRRSSLFFSKFMFAPGTSMLFQFLSVSRTPRLQYRGECSYSRVFPIWRGTAPGSGSTLLATMEVLLQRGIRRLFPAGADLLQRLGDVLLYGLHPPVEGLVGGVGLRRYRQVNGQLRQR